MYRVSGVRHAINAQESLVGNLEEKVYLEELDEDGCYR
jgi:hypothetical protein